MSATKAMETEETMLNGGYVEGEGFNDLKLDLEEEKPAKKGKANKAKPVSEAVNSEQQAPVAKREFANVNVRIPLAVMPKIKAVAILSGYDDVEKFIADAAQDKAGLLQMKISSALTRAGGGRKKKGEE